MIGQSVAVALGVVGNAPAPLVSGGIAAEPKTAPRCGEARRRDPNLRHFRTGHPNHRIVFTTWPLALCRLGD